MSQWLQDKRWFTRVVTSGALGAACLVGSPNGVRIASAEPVVEVRIAPPATRVEVVPARPSPRHFWVHGYWAWTGHSHAWVPGHYEVERRGYGYHEARWENAPSGHWRYHHGGWYRR